MPEGVAIFGDAGSIETSAERVQFLLYKSDGYRYKIGAHGSTSGFQAADFDDSGWSVGPAAFGTTDTNCSLKTNVRTFWPLETDLLARKTFDLPRGASNVLVGISIDNDVQVFVNGTDVSGGLRMSEGCPFTDQFRFAVPDNVLKEGENLLAVRARDRGNTSFFDVRVTGEITDEPPDDDRICLAPATATEAECDCSAERGEFSHFDAAAVRQLQAGMEGDDLFRDQLLRDNSRESWDELVARMEEAIKIYKTAKTEEERTQAAVLVNLGFHELRETYDKIYQQSLRVRTLQEGIAAELMEPWIASVDDAIEGEFQRARRTNLPHGFTPFGPGGAFWQAIRKHLLKKSVARAIPVVNIVWDIAEITANMCDFLEDRADNETLAELGGQWLELHVMGFDLMVLARVYEKELSERELDYSRLNHIFSQD